MIYRANKLLLVNTRLCVIAIRFFLFAPIVALATRSPCTEQEPNPSADRSLWQGNGPLLKSLFLSHVSLNCVAIKCNINNKKPNQTERCPWLPTHR